MRSRHRTSCDFTITYYFPKIRVFKRKVKSEKVIVESCIVKKDCSKSENMVKYFQESEQDEKESELHKGV